MLYKLLSRHYICVFRDSIVVAVGDTLTSIFGGVVIFSFIGYMAHTLNTDVSEVATQGKLVMCVKCESEDLSWECWECETASTCVYYRLLFI